MSSVIGTLQILQLQELDPNDFKCIVDAEIGELGCGLYSHVRLADHRTFGWVAIKCFVITGGGPQKRKLEKKLKKELLVLQQAMNNHIVRIHGYVKWPGSMGLVMEYMPGGDLGQFVSDGPDRLPMKVLLRMMYESSDGIAYMHNLPSDQRVVHGDLKPENVLLSPDLHCKMGDFGCAQLIALTGSTIRASERPQENDMTLGYAPPEKLRSLNIKPKKEQDTYSFGMLLYVLLAGLLPYQHKSQESAFIELIKEGGRPDTTPIDEFKETLSNEDKQILEILQSVMEKCWQQEPSDRPSMIEVRDELQKLYRQQNDVAVMAEVLKTIETMSISIPNADEHQLLPLHLFSPMHGTFLQENVHHIYNMPNVRQAAFGCSTVEFQQTGSANAAEQQERQQTVRTEADELRSSAETSTKRSFKVDKRPISTKEKAEPSSSAAVGARQDVQQSNRDVSKAPSRLSVSRLRSFFGEPEASASSGQSAVNTAKQQGRQQTATTTKADDRKSSAETSTRKSLKVDKKETSVKEKARPPSSTKDMDSKLPSRRKPTLSEVFESSDPSGSPSNVRLAPGFLEKYKVSLKKQKYEEAKTMTTAITSMIEDNIDATAKDVKEFGRKLREKKLFLESIAIFNAASAMFEKMGKTEENLQWMRICVRGMKNTNDAMIGDDASTKVAVRNFVIPLMREKLRHIEDTSLVSEQFKCLQVCWVLYFIEYSEYLVDELEEREKTLRFALTRMKDVFEADALKFQVYGTLLNNLGVVCGRTSRFEEAASFIKQAIDAYKAATDYSEEDLRKKHIATSENNLKLVQQKMK